MSEHLRCPNIWGKYCNIQRRSSVSLFFSFFGGGGGGLGGGGGTIFP